MTNAKLLNKNIYSEDIAHALELYSDFYVVSEVQINGITYKPSMCIVKNFENDEPVFSKIIVIISKNEDILFVCRTFRTETLFHIGGYKLLKSGIIDVIVFDDFFDKYPLSIYKYDGHQVVIPKYSILDPE